MWKKDLYKSDTTKFLLIFLIGIVLGLYINFYSIYILVLVLVSSIFLIAFKKNLFAYLLLVLVSGYLSSFRIADNTLGYSNFIKDEEVKLTGKVIEVLPNTEFGSRFIFKGTIKDDIYPQIKSNFLVNSSFDYENKVKAGSELQIFGKLHLPQKKLLPTDFPENQYLSHYSANFILKTDENKISVLNEHINYFDWNRKQIEFLTQQINSMFSNENSGLVAALLLGDRTNLDKELTKNYSKTGIAHVLSVSGLHIALISAVIFALLSFVRNRVLKFSIFTILVLEFICITNFQIPALRAGAASIIFAFLILNKRYPNSLSITSFVNLALLIYDPNLIKNPSFLLSGFALYGLVFFYDSFYLALRKLLPNYGFTSDLLTKPLASTFAASLLTSILVAYYFEMYSIVSFLSNIILVPIFSLILLYSILALILTFVSSTLGDLLANVVEFLIDISNGINEFLLEYLPTHVSGAYLPIILASIVAICLIYTLSFTTKRNFVWRVINSIFLIITCIFFIPNTKSQAYENNKFKLIHLINNNKDLVLIEAKSKLPVSNQNRINKFIIASNLGTLILSKNMNFDTEEFDKKTKVIRLNSKDFSIIKSQLLAKK